MGLFYKECRKIAISIVYYIFIILLIIVWYQNFAGVTTDEINLAEDSSATSTSYELDRALLAEPSEDDDYFGTKLVEDSDKIMIGAVDMLLSEYNQNTYATYPFGYYKAVTLDSEEQENVLSILCEITGLTEEQLENIPDTYFPSTNGTIIHFQDDTSVDEIEMDQESDEDSSEDNDKTQTFISQVTYERFKELMSELEEIIGRGSNYSIDTLINYFGFEEMTYDEALDEYNSTINDDKVTGGFARLFCDYVSAPLGICPIFIVVIIWLKDRRTKTDELIYSRRISSSKLILNRYLATLTMIMIPVILLSLESLIPLISFGMKNDLDINCFAFLEYIFWWLLPTVMIVTALGTFLTILTDSLISIPVQLLWWFIDRGVTGLSGDTTLFTLMIRHNTLRGYDVIQSDLFIIWTNRLLYVALSFVILVISTWILNKKRRGKIDFWNMYTKLFRTVKAKFKIKHNT